MFSFDSFYLFLFLDFEVIFSCETREFVSFIYGVAVFIYLFINLVKFGRSR